MHRLPTEKLPIHRLYLILAIFLGIVYNILLTPYVVPDEHTHFQESYDISNALLGTSEAQEGYLVMRRSDAEAPFSQDVSVAQYKTIAGLVLTRSDGELVQVTRLMSDSNSICYVVPGIGITLARLLHLGPVLTVWFGRWCNYAVFVFLMVQALKRIPIGKNALLILGMLPMVMQEAMSLSYDCLTNGLSIFLIAHCMKLVLEQDRLSWKDLVLYGVPAALLAGCKGGVYLPICCLGLMIPAGTFGSRKRKALSIAGLCLILGISFLAPNYKILGDVVSRAGSSGTETISESGTEQNDAISGSAFAEEQEEISVEDVEHYSLSDILHHPLHYARVLVSTFKVYGGKYLSELVAGPLGWLNIEIPWWISCGFLFLLLAGALENNETVIFGAGKIWMMILFAGMVLLVMTVMYVSWTPVNSPQVLGVQGRYFIPGLLFLPLVFKNRTIIAKRDLRPVLVLGAMGLELFTWIYILKA